MASNRQYAQRPQLPLIDPRALFAHMIGEGEATQEYPPTPVRVAFDFIRQCNGEMELESHPVQKPYEGGACEWERVQRELDPVQHHTFVRANEVMKAYFTGYLEAMQALKEMDDAADATPQT